MTQETQPAPATAPKEQPTIQLDQVGGYLQRRLKAAENEALLMAALLREHEDVIRRLNALVEQMKAINADQDRQITELKAAATPASKAKN